MFGSRFSYRDLSEIANAEFVLARSVLTTRCQLTTIDVLLSAATEGSLSSVAPVS